MQGKAIGIGERIHTLRLLERPQIIQVATILLKTLTELASSRNRFTQQALLNNRIDILVG